MRDTTPLIASLRAASRSLVRSFGLLDRGVAGTALSPSAAHILLEIGFDPGLTADDLCARLKLPKPTLGRLLQRVEHAGLIGAEAEGRDRRLTLSPKGAQVFKDLDRFAKSQVIDALARLPQGSGARGLSGLSEYAVALTDDTPAQAQILTGYTPGLGARIVELALHCMAEELDFGRAFETRLLGDMGRFLPALGGGRNQTWRAELGGVTVGAITIDGDHLGDNLAHLRWFVMAPEVQGRGLGADLLAAALGFCDAHGFRETHLWTIKGLDKARALYDRTGFSLAEEWTGDQWGRAVTEQRFVRPHPLQQRPDPDA